MHVTYDEEADAIYVELKKHDSVARTHRLDSNRMIDYDDSGEVVGVEFLSVSTGIDLDGVPSAARVAQALRAIPHPVA